MNNNYLASAVSLELSTDMSEKIGFPMFDIIISAARDAMEFESTLNLDLREEMRTIDDTAVGMSWFVASMATPPWDAILKQTGNELLNLFMLLDTSNFLVHSNAFNSVPAIAAKVCNNETHINFVNNYCLFVYEKFIRGKYGPYSTFPYSVYSVSDLGESLPEDEKFTTIYTSGVDLIGEDNLIKSMIDSLAPGGTLVIAQSSHGKMLYNSKYFTDQYYPIHKVLLSNDGITVHSSTGTGITTFKKSS